MARHSRRGPKQRSKNSNFSDSSESSDSSDSKGPSRGTKDKRSQRDIKNARSLSDVLRGATGAKGAKGPTRGPSAPRPVPPDTDRREKPVVSKKLTYIMNFQPPPVSVENPAGKPEKKPAAPPTPIRGTVIGQGAPEPRHSNKASQTKHSKHSKHSKQVPQTKRQPEPAQRRRSEMSVEETHQRADFHWPEDRKTREKAKSTTAIDPWGSRRELRQGGQKVTGIVKRHPDGFGFLIVDNSEISDVYISRQSMTGIMTNDRVEAQVYKPKSSRGGGKDDRLAGEVLRVISRGTSRVVGRFLPVDRKYGVILDENRGWGADLRVATEESLSAKENDLVAVEITRYPGPDAEFTGRVVAIIGNTDDPVNDVIRVIHGHGIPNEFSKQALEEARKFGGQVTPEEIQDREDLTQLPICTIDGATARDFDDAIYVEQDEKGFKLTVAIADVSHYVKPGTPLDQEAYERGTSTYFPNYVVPMLPEELSNELCSLKPQVKRLCFACEMQINFHGEIQDYRFFEAVMESKARVTYGEAQEVLDGANPPKLAEHKTRGVMDNIRRAADLAKILMAKRFREGSLDLEIPETQVVVDSSGETADIIKSERLFAHRLIEELMLVTNICTARFLDEAEIPGVYRVHEEPDPDNLRALQRYLWNLGGDRTVMGGGGGQLQKKLTKALQSMESRPEAQILNILTLRTMKQARYSEANVGHFGLGFTHYSHFTSPIRRYPDLIAHRLIKSQLSKRYKAMQMGEDDLGTATTFLSACEQRSVKAERQLISIKKARFAKRLVGQEFDGMISSVTKFGVFVLLRQYDLDGLIRMENLGKDRFIFDEENLRLIGKRSGAKFSIGDPMRVMIAGADIETGRVELALPEGSKLPNAEGQIEGQAGTEQGEFDERSERGAFKRRSKTGRKDQPKAGKKNRFDVQKRSETQDDRGGVRKKRVSKRRRKN